MDLGIWGFGTMGYYRNWGYGSQGTDGKRWIETRGIYRTGTVVSASVRVKILQPNSTSYLRQSIKQNMSYLARLVGCLL